MPTTLAVNAPARQACRDWPAWHLDRPVDFQQHPPNGARQNQARWWHPGQRHVRRMNAKYRVRATRQHFPRQAPLPPAQCGQCRSNFRSALGCVYAAWPMTLFARPRKILRLHAPRCVAYGVFQPTDVQLNWQ